MRPHVQGRLPALEPLDQRDVPRAAIGIERRRLEQPDELEQLPAVTGRADRHRAEVAGRAEVGHLDPAGPRCECRLDHRGANASEALARGGVEPGDHRLAFGQVIEDHQRADGHAEGGVMAGAPHDRLDGAQTLSHPQTVQPLGRRRFHQIG